MKHEDCFEYYLSGEVPRGEFIMAHTSTGEFPEEDGKAEVHPLYRGENNNLADGLFSLGIFRWFAKLLYGRGKEPHVMYIMNEKDGKDMGFDNWGDE